MSECYYGDIRVVVSENYDEMSAKCAEYIAQNMKKNKHITLGLATGSSPEGTYKELVRMNKSGEIDFSGVTTFNLDEYYPIDVKNEQSYHYFMDYHLFSHVNIDKKNINFPNLGIANAEDCAAEYEKRITEGARINLQLVGIGVNGHIGFNEPSEIFSGETQFEMLSDSTRQANSRFFSSIAEVPTHAITMGVKTIMRADEIVMIVSGENKAQILKEAVLGSITPKNPASVLQLHRKVTIFADKKAAAGMN